MNFITKYAHIISYLLSTFTSCVLVFIYRGYLVLSAMSSCWWIAIQVWKMIWSGLLYTLVSCSCQCVPSSIRCPVYLFSLVSFEFPRWCVFLFHIPMNSLSIISFPDDGCLPINFLTRVPRCNPYMNVDITMLTAFSSMLSVAFLDLRTKVLKGLSSRQYILCIYRVSSFLDEMSHEFFPELIELVYAFNW